MRRPYWLLVTAIVVAPTYGQQPSSGTSDLDTLLAPLGQPGVVNNRPLRTMGAARAQGDLERLGRSNSREVAEAMRRLKPVFEMLEEAAATERKGKELVAKIAQPDLKGSMLFVSDYLQNLYLSDEELRDLREQGKINQREIDLYRETQRDAAANRAKLAEYFKDQGKIEAVTAQKAARLRNQAELNQHTIVAEALVPALRARAGGQRKSPLQVKMGIDTIKGTGGGVWKGAKVNLRSMAVEELTRLSLLLDFQTPQGSRYALFFIPKLPPHGGGSFEPVRLSWPYLNNSPKGAPNNLGPVTVQTTRVRCSAWCDQFRDEAFDIVPMTSREETINDTRLLALLPGLIYASQEGQVLHVNPAAAKSPPAPKGIIGGISSPTPYFAEFEPAGRYDMVFKNLTPTGKDYEVELDLIDRANKSSTQRYRGMVTVPAVKGDTTDKRLSLKVASGNVEMQMELHGDGFDGPLFWTGKGEGGGRKFVPMELPAPGGVAAKVRQRLDEAMGLAVNRKYDEAQAAYEKIEQDYRDTPWAKSARLAVGKLRQLKDSHTKLDETRKAEEAVQNISRSTPAVGRPSVAKRIDPPSRKPALEERRQSAQGERVDADTPTRVVVDDVEYVFQGAVRSGEFLVVAVLATSKQGDREGPRGAMTLIDANGKRFTGQPAGGRGSQAELKEGKPVKLTWKFGGSSFGGGKHPLPAVAKDAEFSRVTIGIGRNSIEFRDVPASGK